MSMNSPYVLVPAEFAQTMQQPNMKFNGMKPKTLKKMLKENISNAAAIEEYLKAQKKEDKKKHWTAIEPITLAMCIVAGYPLAGLWMYLHFIAK